MTADTHPDPLFLHATAASVRAALLRRFRITPADGFGSRHITDYPDLAASLVMGIVGPVLEAKDQEIKRLRSQARGGNEDGGHRALEMPEP